MDANLMSCPTCGHSVSNSAGACTYCGAMTEFQQPPTVVDEVTAKAQNVDTPPPLPGEEKSLPESISADEDEATKADVVQLNPNAFQPPPESQAAREISYPAAETESVSADESAAAGEEVEIKPDDDQPKSEFKPEIIQPAPDSGGSDESDTGQADELKPDSEGDSETAAEKESDVQALQGETAPVDDGTLKATEIGIETEADTAEMQSPPEVVDLNVDELDESVTLGENIVKLVETDAARQKAEISSTSEESLTSEESIEETEANPKEAKATQPNMEAEDEVDTKAGLMPESTGETIVLEADDEIRPSAAETPQMNAKKARLESPAESQVLKIEKAALEKARALKKQKMMLAKAAALKRKKAALAKAQAQKKPSPAAKKTTNAVRSGRDLNLAATSKLRGLLEKYKGQAIGINYNNSADLREARLADVNSEYFSVFVENDCTTLIRSNPY